MVLTTRQQVGLSAGLWPTYVMAIMNGAVNTIKDLYQDRSSSAISRGHCRQAWKQRSARAAGRVDAIP